MRCKLAGSSVPFISLSQTCVVSPAGGAVYAVRTSVADETTRGLRKVPG